MKRHILQFALVAVSLVPAASSAQATERSYAPMLVDGRTWEYMFVREYYRRYIMKERLSGTVERFGQTYHVLTNPDTNDTIALLREEKGQVFLLMDRKGEIIDMCSPSAEHGQFDESTETVVYDFSMEEGDRMTRFNYITEYGDECTAYKSAVELAEKTSHSVFGKERVHQRLRLITDETENMPSEECPYYEALEGIGIVYGGDLPYYCPLGLMTGQPKNAKRELVRVYENDGTVIYGKGFTRYEPLVREDRIWEYASHGAGGETTLTQARFVGTTEINGKEYRNLRITEETTWEDLRADTEPVTVHPDRTVALMREENGRVYACVRETSPGNRGLYEGVLDKEHSEGAYELLLYDFNAEMGETFRTGGSEMPCHEGCSKLRHLCWDPSTFFILDSDSIEIRGKKMKRTTYSHDDIDNVVDNVIEGIGPSQWTLWNPIVLRMACDPSYSERLNGVSDGDGNHLFGDFSLTKSGYRGIEATENENSALSYSGGVIRAKGTGVLVLELFSADGIKTARAEGSGEISVSASGLVPGVYLVTLSSDGKSVSTLRIRI